MIPHQKDFQKWSVEKQRIHAGHPLLYCKEREIWWATLGINIGREIDGKQRAFERPVLILKRVNRDTILAIPLTSRNKNLADHVAIVIRDRASFAVLSQIRSISSKRLLRKITVVSTQQFNAVTSSLHTYLFG